MDQRGRFTTTGVPNARGHCYWCQKQTHCRCCLAYNNGGWGGNDLCPCCTACLLCGTPIPREGGDPCYCPGCRVVVDCCNHQDTVALLLAVRGPLPTDLVRRLHTYLL